MENLQGGMLTLEHRYVIEQLQGRHAFVTLYRGTHEAFRRPVWIGIYDVMAEAGGDLALADALRARALEASGLTGDGVLRVIDYGELEEGVPFVISERIAAPTLQSVLERQGVLDPRDTAALVERLAQVLSAIHARGLSHGNLSPRWIYLPEEDPCRAMVAHAALGLSLPEMRRLEAISPGVDALWPIPPEALGDHDEERPGVEDEDERGAGADGGQAADVYALGLVAYQSLVGQHPHFGEDSDPSDGILRMSKGGARPLEELGLEAGISQAVARALAPEPGRRWRTPEAFAAALRSAVEPAVQTEVAEKAGKNISSSGTTRPSSLVDSSDEALDSAAHEPSRLGTFAAIAVSLLVVSNLAWFFVLVGSEDPPASDTPAQESGPGGGGIELHTEPAQARVVLAESGSVLGQTPLVLHPRDGDGGVLRLRVERDGFRNMTLDLRQGDGTADAPGDLVLYLLENEGEHQEHE